MEYIVQIITLTLAMLGILFENVKKDQDGKNKKLPLQLSISKGKAKVINLLVPTTAGWMTIIFLVISVSFSVALNWRKAKQADSQANEYKAVIERLRDDVSAKNNQLQNLLKNQHQQAIDQLQALLLEQRTQG